MIKYQITREELWKLSVYMTARMYKSIRVWIVTAVVAWLLAGIFHSNFGIVTWFGWYAAILVLYFIIFHFLNFGRNQKTMEEVELILENGRVRCVTEEGEYGISFRAKEICSKKSFCGLLIMRRDFSLGKGKKKVYLGSAYHVLPERVFESKEAREEFLARLEEQAAWPTDPEESAGGKNPLYVFKTDTTEEKLAKLRFYEQKYQISKKMGYRIWLKVGMFALGFILMQVSWAIVKIIHMVTDAPLSAERLWEGSFLYTMLGIVIGMFFMMLKPNMKGHLRRVRRNKKEQANIGAGEIWIFDKLWVSRKEGFESYFDSNRFGGITEFEDAYLFRAKNDHAIMLLGKDGEDPEKLQSFIEYCKIRGDYNVYREPAKWPIGKKIFTAIICIAILAVVGYAGTLAITLDRLAEEQGMVEEYIFDPTGCEDYLPFDEQLKVLEQLGFTVSKESINYLEEWMEASEYGKLYVEGYPYYELLMELGYQKYDQETWEVIEYSKQAYWLDFEGWDISTDYIEILKGVAAMSDGELEFTDMKEDIKDVNWDEGTGTIDVTFECNGNAYEFEANVMNDWIDADFIGFINDVLDKEGYTKNLYACYDGGQGNVLFYRDEAWALEFVSMTGIELGLDAQ